MGPTDDEGVLGSARDEPPAARADGMTDPARDTPQVRVALREWAVVVSELQRGSLTTLVRKGGIHEVDGVAHFAPEHAAFALVPTWLHQRPERTRFPGAVFTTGLDGAPHPAPRPAPDGSLTVPITSWAESVAAWWIRDRAQLAAIETFTAFPMEELASRFVYRRDGLWLLAIRVWGLSGSVERRLRPDQIACASWIELDDPVSGARLTPACPDEAFDDVSRALRARLGPPTVEPDLAWTGVASATR